MLRVLPTRLILALVAAALLVVTSARTQSIESGNSSANPKKAKQAYEKGRRAEKAEDWQAAFDEFALAVKWSPDKREYLLHRDLARSRLVQEYVDRAERDAVVGRFEEARGELRAAIALDPGDSVARERLDQLVAEKPGPLREIKREPEPGGEIHLQPQPGKRNFDYRGDTQGAYTELAQQFGVTPAFDVDLRSRPVRLQIEDVDFQTAMRVVGDMTGTFWKPLTSRVFFVAEDTLQKRREYDASVVRTVILPASETTDQMNETLRVVRDIAGITRSQLDTASRELTMRASPQAISVATQLIQEIEQANGEMILEIEILEVDRNAAMHLGITPGTSSEIFSVSKQQLQQAEQSTQGLVSVLTQIFGQPSSLTGLGTGQIGSLVGSGQISLNSLIPPLVAFGGGQTTFFATLPGTAANFSETLSLVRSGRRVFLRAQDARPATFFVGDRVPISLALFSASLSSSQFVPGVTPGVFPTSNFATGTTPVALVAASLNDLTDSFPDLAVVNQGDKPPDLSILLNDGTGKFIAKTPAPTTGTLPLALAAGTFDDTANSHIGLAVVNQGDTPPDVSILLGDGNGNFTAKTPGPTVGTKPVAIVAADFNGDGHTDLAVVNQGDNTVSILLGKGDGTFTPTSLPATGNKPVAIVVADFNGDGIPDLAVVNQGDTPPDVSILLGNKDPVTGLGNGTFTLRSTLVTGNMPSAIAAADFTLDGRIDLAVTNEADNTVSIFLGNGDGTFSAQTTFPTGRGPVALAIGDFNIDGLPDVAVANQTDNTVSILINVGHGAFAQKLDLPAGTGPIGVVAGDFDNDSRIDLAIADQTANTVTVILNSATFVAPGTAAASRETPFPGSEYEDIGLKIKATPRIHHDDEVTLQLQFEIRSLSATNVNGIPVISNRTLEQTVRLRENETSALAGILEPQEMHAITGYPGLAEIPDFGGLFGTRTTNNTDTELLILITPRMVRVAPRLDRSFYAGHEPPTGGVTSFRGAENPPQ